MNKIVYSLAILLLLLSAFTLYLCLFLLKSFLEMSAISFFLALGAISMLMGYASQFLFKKLSTSVLSFAAPPISISLIISVLVYFLLNIQKSLTEQHMVSSALGMLDNAAIGIVPNPILGAAAVLLFSNIFLPFFLRKSN